MLCTVLHLLLCIPLSARMSRRHRIIAVHLRTNPSGGQARLSGVSAECGGVIWSKTTLFAIDGTARTRWIDRKGYAREAMYLSGTRNLQTDWCWKSIHRQHDSSCGNGHTVTLSICQSGSNSYSSLHLSSSIPTQRSSSSSSSRYSRKRPLGPIKLPTPFSHEPSIGLDPRCLAIPGTCATPGHGADARGT